MNFQKQTNIRSGKNAKTEYYFREISAYTERDNISSLAAIIGLFLAGALVFGAAILIIKLFAFAFTACLTVSACLCAFFCGKKLARHMHPAWNR